MTSRPIQVVRYASGMSATKLKTITVRVTSDIEDRLLRLARELRRSRSSVANEAIELFLKRQEGSPELLLTENDFVVEP
jgi:hypothetical protein